MEENKEIKLSQGKLILQYGLVLGGIMIGIHLLSYALNIGKPGSVVGIIVSLITLVIGAVVMVKASVLYRDEVLGGYMKYGKAFVISFFVALVAVAIVAIYTYLFYAFFDPEYLEKLMLERINTIQNNPNISLEDKEIYITQIESGFKPISTAIGFFIQKTILFLIVSLITAAIAKKKEVESSELI